MHKLLIAEILLLFTVVLTSNCQKTKGRTGASEKILEDFDSEKPSGAVEIDLTILQNSGKMPISKKVNIEYDHFFHTAKTYQAYSLKMILEPYILELGLDSSSDAVVTFHCTDGYKPTQKLSELMEGDGYIAFRDLSVVDTTQNWPDTVQAKLQPFYLTWKNDPFGSDRFTWPYGLYKLELNPKAYNSCAFSYINYLVFRYPISL